MFEKSGRGRKYVKFYAAMALHGLAQIEYLRDSIR